MNMLTRAGMAALAFAAASAPIASASALPPPASTPNAFAPVLTTVWVVGTVLCTGMSFGRQDVLAAKAGTVVTGADRFKAFATCLVPPLGFAKLAQ